MLIPVLIEGTPDGRYRASTGQILAIQVEGSSEVEALDRVRSAIRARLPLGAIEKLTCATFDVPLPEPPPPIPLSELYSDADWFDRTFQQAIEENRRREDDMCSFNELGHFNLPAHEDFCI
jgi:hypothetical protein